MQQLATFLKNINKNNNKDKLGLEKPMSLSLE